MIDHALASAMQSLDILLLDRLLRDERDVRLACGGADRFSVVAVVLLRTKGFTYCGLMIFTRWPSASNLRAQQNAPVQASTTIVQRSTCATMSRS